MGPNIKKSGPGLFELLSHFTEKRKNNNTNTDKNNRFPPYGGILIIQTITIGVLPDGGILINKISLAGPNAWAGRIRPSGRGLGTPGRQPV